MKQMTFSKVLMAVACVLILCMAAPTMAVADQAQYIYDDLGRLSQVIDGQGNVASYTYDAVGNLLSIARKRWGSVLDLAPRRAINGEGVQIQELTPVFC